MTSRSTPTFGSLHDPAAPAEVRIAALTGAQAAAGNAAVARQLAQRDKAPPPAAAPAEAPAAPALSVADLAEFELLKGKITDGSAAAYIRHRDEFFGSAAAYQSYAEIADAELDGTKGLRGRIEFTKQPEAQTVFYRWVRKAYENAGVSDIPGLINRGASEELKTALAAVKEGYGKPFRSGGFNPRPMKSAKYQYRLGTISEHALGKAIDIEAGSNPIISKADWAWIETMAGKSADRARSRWENTPEALWRDINEINTLFVAKITAEVERITVERAAAAAVAPAPAPAPKPKKKGKKGKAPPTPLDEVFKGHAALKQWAAGFFTLDWALVEQLHAQNFVWGATFSSSVDLHHFELAKPKPAGKPKK